MSNQVMYSLQKAEAAEALQWLEAPIPKIGEDDVLDAILERHVEAHQDADEIIAAGFEPEVVRHVLRLVRINEYKRRQMAPGLIVTSKAFASGRRYPLASRYRYGA